MVFLAVPHQGALDAVEAMIRGETTLFAGRKEMRKLARSFPGVYELLPRYEGAIVADGRGLSAFDIGTWQQNVTPEGKEASGFEVKQDHLTKAAAVLDGLRDPVAAGLEPTEVLTVYGAREQNGMRLLSTRTYLITVPEFVPEPEPVPEKKSTTTICSSSVE